ncbi:MAG: hypothetical protein ACOYNI_09370 [Acidimicrobiia bacterium]
MQINPVGAGSVPALQTTATSQKNSTDAAESVASEGAKKVTAIDAADHRVSDAVAMVIAQNVRAAASAARTLGQAPASASPGSVFDVRM